jgi:hypothetical protein
MLQGGVWSYQPRDAAAVEQAAAEAAAEAAEAAARQAFLQEWAAAASAAAAQRPVSTAEQQQQWLAGPNKDRVQALLVSQEALSATVGSGRLPMDYMCQAPAVCYKLQPQHSPYLLV